MDAVVGCEGEHITCRAAILLRQLLVRGSRSG